MKFEKKRVRNNWIENKEHKWIEKFFFYNKNNGSYQNPFPQGTSHTEKCGNSQSCRSSINKNC